MNLILDLENVHAAIEEKEIIKREQERKEREKLEE